MLFASSLFVEFVEIAHILLIMKCIIVFSVLCLVAVSRADQGRNDKAIEECGRELNIQSIDKYLNRFNKEDYSENPDEVLCMRACYYRKFFGTTLYKAFMQILNEDKAGNKTHRSFKFTREDVVSKMNDCFKKEPEECKFFKCIDPFNGPVAEWFF